MTDAESKGLALAGSKDVEAAREQSVQSRARGEIGLSLLLWLAGGNELVPPWWSRNRDVRLRRFWKEVDYLEGAVYTMEARMKTVPWRITPKDLSVKAHHRLADHFTELLLNEADYGAGWGDFYSTFVEDLLTQDNGSFNEIIGEGEPDGPLVGRPLGIAHLDSARCIRTGDPEFPVIYQDSSGRRSKLHFTRVTVSSQMPSPAEEMYGVGVSAVSRCLNVSQNLLDILVYKQEKLGSRPYRGIMVTQGGLDPDDVKDAVAQAADEMSNQRLRRFAKTVVIGSDDAPEADISLIDLASLPDNFDERDSVTLGMSTMALAFGVDARELFPGLQSGATRAEALIAHIKQRGKGPGDILQTTERFMNQKFVPNVLHFEFDFQDDEQDRAVEEIKALRSKRYVELGSLGLLDPRSIHEEMLEEGDISDAQFARMELKAGRMPDGSDVLTLFHSPDHAELLDLGVPDPTDIKANDPDVMLEAIDTVRRGLMASIVSANPGQRQTINEAMAALDRLEPLYGGNAVTMVRPGAAEEREQAEAMDAARERVEGQVGGTVAEEGTETDTLRPPPLGEDDLLLKGNGRSPEEVKTAALAIQRAAEAIQERYSEDEQDE